MTPSTFNLPISALSVFKSKPSFCILTPYQVYKDIQTLDSYVKMIFWNLDSFANHASTGDFPYFAGENGLEFPVEIESIKHVRYCNLTKEEFYQTIGEKYLKDFHSRGIKVDKFSPFVLTKYKPIFTPNLKELSKIVKDEIRQEKQRGR